MKTRVKRMEFKVFTNVIRSKTLKIVIRRIWERELKIKFCLLYKNIYKKRKDIWMKFYIFYI